MSDVRVSAGKLRLEGQVYRPILCPRCGRKPGVVRTTPAIRTYYCESCDHEFRIPVAGG